MANECVLPELGENIAEATVVEVFISVGDVVAIEQPVLSLETDKAEFDLPSTVAGRVSELMVAVGDDVAVGQLLFRVDGDAAGAEPAETARPEATSALETTAGESSPEPAAATGEPAGVAVDVTDARAATVESPAAGPVGEASATAGARAGEVAQSAKSAPVEIAAAPSVRRLARELGVNLAEVTGSGPGGRVSAADVNHHVRASLVSQSAAPAGPAAAGAGALPDFSRWGPIEEKPMSKVRRKTAEQMALAWANIPHVTHHDLADITELDRLRKQYGKRVEKAGGKLTMTAVLLKVLASALKRYPKFNASIDVARSLIVYKHYVHLGVAVDTEKGLLVPVIRDADKKNIIDLALELREASERARGRNITPDMLQGATFTITNLGGIGGTAFSPIINPPEVAVLGVSAARHQPVYVEGEFVPRLLMPLSVSYDHRVIDGADAARFLRWVCEALEEPFVMDLEGR